MTPDPNHKPSRLILTLAQRMRLGDWIFNHRQEIPTSTVHEFVDRAREHFKLPGLTRIHILSTLKSLELTPETPRFKISPRSDRGVGRASSGAPSRAELAAHLGSLYRELGLEVPASLLPFVPSSLEPNPRFQYTPQSVDKSLPRSALSPSPLRPRR